MRTAAEKDFIRLVKKFYKENGRHRLPWRQTTDPYKILVSEVMLAQTQVDRVIPKYQAFVKRFPTVKRLAAAPLGEVLKAWQGLGYNRRAQSLHRCAQTVAKEKNGAFPELYSELLALPAIGPYTAGAVMAFAYNAPVPIIETNIRTVYLHHFYKDKKNISDAEILKVVEKTLDRKNPREWYSALMDYGTHLKKTLKVSNHSSSAYKKQSTFKGSDREIRGALVRCLAAGACTKRQLFAALAVFETDRLTTQLNKLRQEGLVVYRKGVYALP